MLLGDVLELAEISFAQVVDSGQIAGRIALDPLLVRVRLLTYRLKKGHTGQI